MRVAFLGIGKMGSRMAPRLANAGHEVKAWNRSPEKARAVVQRGLQACGNWKEAVADAECVITMLADGGVVEEVLFGSGLAEALPPNALVIDMSSIPPTRAKDHAGRLEATGHDHVDAPVSGGTIGAAEGKLAIMAGGTEAAFERARPLFQVLGRPTHVGPPGSGQLTKLCNQIIVAITIGAVSEALLLGAAGGAEPGAVRGALQGGFADSRILQEHGRRMLDRDWAPGGVTEHQLKDLDTALELAKAWQLTLPVTETIRGLFRSLRDQGYGGLDHASLLLEIERLNPGCRVGDAPDRFP